MSGSRPAVCIAVMLLLGVACTRRRCDYPMVLSTYRQLIFAELQSMNLTDPFGTSTEKDRCPSNKVDRIVRSIYGMTEQFECLSKGQKGDSMSAVVSRMGQLIKLYCKKKFMGNEHHAKSCRIGQRKKERLRRQIKMIHMLVNCWQKLQSLDS